MQATIGNNLLTKLKPQEKPYDVRDIKLVGFLIRVNISGKMLYMCEYARGKRISIGKVCVLTPMQARDRAKEILADFVKGIDPSCSRRLQGAFTLNTFINKEYCNWVIANRKCGKGTIARINANFMKSFGFKKLSEINLWDIEKWRSEKLNNGAKAATVNRDITALKAALSKAIEWGIIDCNALAQLKPSKVDNIAMLRYLYKDEEIRLRTAMDLRQEKLVISRSNANEWRAKRNYEVLPSLNNQCFADYIKPMVILSLNTGLRRGELFDLKWSNINFDLATLTIDAHTAKSGKTRHIPLNNEALKVLVDWQDQQQCCEGLVFHNIDGARFNNVKRAWFTLLKMANIQRFRWHDMRHHFASRLVMSGVDLNTVRELLGHTDIKMTLRYAHLAPEHKAEAVARLCNQFSYA